MMFLFYVLDVKFVSSNFTLHYFSWYMIQKNILDYPWQMNIKFNFWYYSLFSITAKIKDPYLKRLHSSHLACTSYVHFNEKEIYILKADYPLQYSTLHCTLKAEGENAWSPYRSLTGKSIWFMIAKLCQQS